MCLGAQAQENASWKNLADISMLLIEGKEAALCLHNTCKCVFVCMCVMRVPLRMYTNDDIKLK